MASKDSFECSRFVNCNPGAVPASVIHPFAIETESGAFRRAMDNGYTFDRKTGSQAKPGVTATQYSPYIWTLRKSGRRDIKVAISYDLNDARRVSVRGKLGPAGGVLGLLLGIAFLPLSIIPAYLYWNSMWSFPICFLPGIAIAFGLIIGVVMVPIPYVRLAVGVLIGLIAIVGWGFLLGLLIGTAGTSGKDAGMLNVVDAECRNCLEKHARNAEATAPPQPVPPPPKAIRCPGCGTQNFEPVNYCTGCGRPVRQ